MADKSGMKKSDKKEPLTPAMKQANAIMMKGNSSTKADILARAKERQKPRPKDGKK